jgi:hypothetical protein
MLKKEAKLGDRTSRETEKLNPHRTALFAPSAEKKKRERKRDRLLRLRKINYPNVSLLPNLLIFVVLVLGFGSLLLWGDFTLCCMVFCV